MRLVRKLFPVKTRIDEYIVPDKLFNLMKQAGEKIGINVKRSDTIFDYLKRAESGIIDLTTYATLYILADNQKQRQELYNDMKAVIRGINKKEIVAFLMQLDRSTIGITAHIRHILMSLLGIEIATYNKKKDTIEVIMDEITKLRRLLKEIGAGNDIIKLVDEIESYVKIFNGGIEEDGATLTTNIATFDKRLPITTFRRKRNKSSLLHYKYMKENDSTDDDEVIVIKKTSQCDKDELLDFHDVLNDEGDISISLGQLKKLTEYLAFLYKDGELVAISSLKSPVHAHYYFTNAGAQEHMSKVKYEIGYSATLPEYRNRGYNKLLKKELMKIVNNKVYSIVRVDNVQSNIVNKQLGMRVVGKPVNVEGAGLFNLYIYGGLL